ncbi:MAG: hypothetical protein HY321_17275 [Armatimonadetes bacterium]|nr:hypothetical protein [Armatimonadota bacterium]
MSDGGFVRERAIPDAAQGTGQDAPSREPESSPPGHPSSLAALWSCCRAPTPTVLGIALGAAALGALGVWLYLHAGSDPQDRASHRIEALRQRLDALAGELARYAEHEEQARQRPGAEQPGGEG